MTTEATIETKGRKAKGKSKGKSNGAVVELAKLEKLPRGQSRSVQETFRATPDEHNRLVAKAAEKGFNSMSDFYRDVLGLDS